MTLKHSNYFALVTGSAGLLGQNHCEALAEIGYNLILTDNNKVALKRQHYSLIKKFKNVKILSFNMDVSSEKSVKKVGKIIDKKKIKLKVLINNAALDSKVSGGKISKKNFFENFDLKQWNNEIKVGLTGAFICAKIFSKNFIKFKTPAIIVNIASDLSVIAPDQRLYINSSKPVSYSVIKSGIVGLTKYLSTYFAKNKIRCNSLSPGGIDNKQSKNFKKKISKLIPLNRMAKKNEYKEAIKFLCSDKNNYMTGHNLIIDGGRSVW